MFLELAGPETYAPDWPFPDLIKWGGRRFPLLMVFTKRFPEEGQGQPHAMADVLLGEGEEAIFLYDGAMAAKVKGQGGWSTTMEEIAVATNTDRRKQQRLKQTKATHNLFFVRVG